jgi:hypothetical protein
LRFSYLFVGLALLLAGCGGGGSSVISGGGGGGTGGVSGTAVRGRVVDAVSRAVISNATVKVGSQTTRTGSDGRFIVAAPANTQLTINVTATNYNPGTFSTIVDLGQQMDVGDLPLSSALNGPPPPPL